MELSGSRLKIFPIFSYISGNGNPPPKFLILQEILQTEKSPLKSFYILLYFGKQNFLALILQNFLYFLKRKLFLYFAKSKFLSSENKKTLSEKTSYIVGAIKNLLFSLNFILYLIIWGRNVHKGLIFSESL